MEVKVKNWFKKRFDEFWEMTTISDPTDEGYAIELAVPIILFTLATIVMVIFHIWG
jgi:hypothetical protein